MRAAGRRSFASLGHFLPATRASDASRAPAGARGPPTDGARPDLEGGDTCKRIWKPASRGN
ncbi:hypothetical protein F01_410389 [Burkholderia cenocepacia]|nr:hypothetical protein F01_410389 [Burkholderia cenocepacia]